MSGTLRVHWTIRTSTSDPKPILRCSRCDQPRPFEPSGRFRLNANGKRLDAWLIYRCAACGGSWNRAIFERRRRSEIDGAMLEKLQSNDPVLADEIARDVAGLARWTVRFDGAGDGAITIGKAVLEGSPADAVRVAITVSLAAGTAMRCDRILALGLGMPRGSVAALARDGCIVVDGSARKAPSRLLREGSLVELRLAGSGEGCELARRATCPVRTPD